MTMVLAFLMVVFSQPVYSYNSDIEKGLRSWDRMDQIEYSLFPESKAIEKTYPEEKTWNVC
jgi:hypothetical protein